MLTFNDTWVAINGVLVALHPGTPKDVGGGRVIHTGTVDANLGLREPITIYIEWVDGGGRDGAGGGEGKVLGYLPAGKDSGDAAQNVVPRGFEQFKANDVVSFLYDWYTPKGEYITTAPGHIPVIVGTKGLELTQKDISTEEYVYYGILQDAMHRSILTEPVHHEGK